MRSRRAKTQSRLSVRRCAASVRSLAARFSLSARSVVSSSAAALAPAPLKERRALRAPCLLYVRILRSDRIEQHAREDFGIEGIGTGCGHQLAELFDPLRLQRTSLVAQYLKFGIIVTNLPHRLTLPRNDRQYLTIPGVRVKPDGSDRASKSVRKCEADRECALIRRCRRALRCAS